jgi:hypothetical protein
MQAACCSLWHAIGCSTHPQPHARQNRAPSRHLPTMRMTCMHSATKTKKRVTPAALTHDPVAVDVNCRAHAPVAQHLRRHVAAGQQQSGQQQQQQQQC